MEHLLSIKEAAAHLNVSVGFLNKMRAARIGPEFVYIGKRVLYQPAAIEAWVSQNVQKTNG